MAKEVEAMHRDEVVSISYPRRRLARGLLRGLGRVLVPLLTRTQTTGLGHFPAHGPLLVVGNHIAAMEVVLMVVYAPWQMELLGPGDIAPPPLMNAIARLHGFIPVNRGNLDRRALNEALDVLRQGGILGIFTEGGIWDPGAMEAKRGVAWLSHHAGAPILPIGFAGLEGALARAFKLQRPPLTMNVGTLLPPVIVPPGIPRKAALQQAAQDIMAAVERLIPPDAHETRPDIVDERFELTVLVHNGTGRAVDIPADYAIVHAEALCKILYRPAILRIFAKDLHLPVAPLQHLDVAPAPSELAMALDAILGYLSADNPGFFTYRFGPFEGHAMELGLRELGALAHWAAGEELALTIHPVRRYRLAGEDTEHVETSPGSAHVW